MSKTSKKTAVDRTRLTWVLAALVAAMTTGTMLLGVLEPNKARRSEKTTYLAAASRTSFRASISRTSIPVENDLWQGVSIHTLSRTNGDYSLPCLARGDGPSPIVHFVICEDSQVAITKAWVNQTPAARSRGNILIGIKYVSGQTEATLDQAKALVALVKDLQSRCNIAADRVKVHCDSSRGSCKADPLARYDWRKCLLH
jgi:hypothetical protein